MDEVRAAVGIGRGALERAAKLFSKRVRDDAKREETAARLRADVSGDGAAEADLLIEAIFENLEAKQALGFQPGDLVTSINGIALDNKTVADFMVRLEDCGLFKSVDLKTLKRKKAQNGTDDSYRFDHTWFSCPAPG